MSSLVQETFQWKEVWIRQNDRITFPEMTLWWKNFSEKTFNQWT